MDSSWLNRFSQHYLPDEEQVVRQLLSRPGLSAQQLDLVSKDATALVEAVRANPEHFTPLERFLGEYSLGTEEGVLLMCLAETLLRIPDRATANLLIADKLGEADWDQHLGNHDLLVNASTWGLLLTGRLLPDLDASQPGRLWRNLLARFNGQVIRKVLTLAMRIVGDQFVLGETISAALARAGKSARPHEDYSFDMLGEAALTRDDARRYLDAYLEAIHAIGSTQAAAGHLGISVKLSALCPRFETRHWQRARLELRHALQVLAEAAMSYQLMLTVDAEESDRLVLGLEVFEAVFTDAALHDWHGLGLAVQAYQKRALCVIDFLRELARANNRVIPVRLVKGAYWDTEIKQAQLQGLAGFPVFTRKCNTDLSYQAAVLQLAASKDVLKPQFATHNAYTVAWVRQCFAPGECEFQRLHGMGETLYALMNETADSSYRCRVYAPVGSHEVLLPYLVRRLLENGANTSFVHRIADADIPVADIVAAPTALVSTQHGAHQNPRIALPCNLFGSERSNSSGVNLADRRELAALHTEVLRQLTVPLEVRPSLPVDDGVKSQPICNPATGVAIGSVVPASPAAVGRAIDMADAAWQDWEATPAAQRAAMLEAAAVLLEKNRAVLIALCIRETGKTLTDAHNEVREAVDFLRYYATECRRLFAAPVLLPGPVGEANTLQLRGKGVFFCISPWNFPVAIFTGQLAAALAAGNTVLAKPAAPASATAAHIISLLIRAGVPAEVLQFVPGGGATIGSQVLADPRLAGVAFTGSNATAASIQQVLVARGGALTTFIAETGGINAMLADSSALPEQVVRDAVMSAFNSAGQRCSALRVLCVQEEVADRIIELIRGSMRELVVGDPQHIATDVGPVISGDAVNEIEAHIAQAQAGGRVLYRLPLDAACRQGHFVAPTLISLDHFGQLDREVFGPVLHILRFRADNLMSLCDDINASGYALTFGLHSRIGHRVDEVCRRIRAGNVYVNRNMIGAVVGSQPFGGNGLSGTGPKAGGPHYLQRFADEQTISNNTAAIGGDPATLAAGE